MKKLKTINLLYLILLLMFYSCSDKKEIKYDLKKDKYKTVKELSEKDNLWVFYVFKNTIVEDFSINDKSILTIKNNNKIVYSKDKFQYEFAKSIKEIFADVNILFIPIGYKDITTQNWISDSLNDGLKPFSDYLSKICYATNIGTIQGVIYEQNDLDLSSEHEKGYLKRLNLLFDLFRRFSGHPNMPIMIDMFSDLDDFNNHYFNRYYPELFAKDDYLWVIPTADIDIDKEEYLGEKFAFGFKNLYSKTFFKD